MGRANRKKYAYLAFEYSITGVCRLHIHNKKTNFKADGYDYNKLSTVFAEFFNHHFNTKKLFKRKSIKNMYGHTRGKFDVGIDVTTYADILETLQGFNLDYIVDTKDTVIYKLEYDEGFLNLDKKDELFLSHSRKLNRK